MLTSYHTHCFFCDGKLSPEEYIRSAICKGFTAVGFSCHAPLNFDTEWTIKPEKLQSYLDTIQQLKEKYRELIQIYTGLETDFYPGSRDYRSLTGLDYTIGSIHFIQDAAHNEYRAFDGTVDQFKENIDCLFHGDIRALVEAYYALIRDMIVKRPPNILGHLDVLKKNNKENRFFDETESWYKNIVDATLETIQKQQVIVEMNTGGISRGYTSEVYPSQWILMRMRERNIPVQLNSDAHHPDWIDAYYREATEFLIAAGYTSQRILLDGVWQDVAL